MLPRLFNPLQARTVQPATCAGSWLTARLTTGNGPLRAARRDGGSVVAFVPLGVLGARVLWPARQRSHLGGRQRDVEKAQILHDNDSGTRDRINSAASSAFTETYKIRRAINQCRLLVHKGLATSYDA